MINIIRMTDIVLKMYMLTRSGDVDNLIVALK